MDLRSNLSKARGLGSAHEGANHWWMQRVTAIALIPLVMWFVSSVIKATSYHGIDGVMYLLSSPFNAITMILFLGTSIYHGTLGIKVIIEDYVHCTCGNKFLDIFTKFVAVISIVAVTFTIFYVHIKTYDNLKNHPTSFWQRNISSCHKNLNNNIDVHTTESQKSDEGKPSTATESPQE